MMLVYYKEIVTYDIKKLSLKVQMYGDSDKYVCPKIQQALFKTMQVFIHLNCWNHHQILAANEKVLVGSVSWHAVI